MATSGIDNLNRQIEEGQRLLGSRCPGRDDYDAWSVASRTVVEACFGSDSKNVKSFEQAGDQLSFPLNAGDEWWGAYRIRRLSAQVNMLMAFVDCLRMGVGHAAIGHVDATQFASRFRCGRALPPRRLVWKIVTLAFLSIAVGATALLIWSKGTNVFDPDYYDWAHAGNVANVGTLVFGLFGMVASVVRWVQSPVVRKEADRDRVT